MINIRSCNGESLWSKLGIKFRLAFVMLLRQNYLLVALKRNNLNWNWKGLKNLQGNYKNLLLYWSWKTHIDEMNIWTRARLRNYVRIYYKKFSKIWHFRKSEINKVISRMKTQFLDSIHLPMQTVLKNSQLLQTQELDNKCWRIVKLFILFTLG